MNGRTDTIAAIATAPGRGGIGIVRLSGPDALQIAATVTGTTLTPRHATYCDFHANNELIDNGVALYFPGPHSFTGEDVVELQGHGGPVVMDSLLRETLRLGARLARAGEFSERAFLNDKIDLAQAEAIADLIDSASEQAARGAVRSLQGEFSHRIHALVEDVIQLRMYVEAAIDFPEEEIDFLSDGKVAGDLDALLQNLQTLLAGAQQGSLLREGMNVVIAGRPNAGKSSLLNALAGRESAIVTDVPGTTRDVLREHIQIDGMPLHIIDTAGLRSSTDLVEQEGVRRARQAVQEADRVLLVIDAGQQPLADPTALLEELSVVVPPDRLTVIYNKSDLVQQLPADDTGSAPARLHLSARTGAGVPRLREHLKACMGYHSAGEGSFTARRRHIDALERALRCLQQGSEQLQTTGAGELLAEDLRRCQQCLGEITGEFTPDDLLGRIFSSFCIGK